MKKSELKKLIKEEILKALNETLDLSTLKIGQTIKISSSSELAPFNLKLHPSGQAISDLPELDGIVFKYEGNTLTRIK